MVKSRKQIFRKKRTIKKKRRIQSNKKNGRIIGGGGEDGKENTEPELNTIFNMAQIPTTKTPSIRLKTGEPLIPEKRIRNKQKPPMPTPPPIEEYNVDFWMTNGYFTQLELDGVKGTIANLWNTNQICGVLSEIKNYKISYDAIMINKAIYDKYLCLIILVYGILSKKMTTTGDYDMLFKGGKALQLAFSKANVPEIEYSSNDVDILIIPKKDILYDFEKIKTFSINISKLIKWLVNGIDTRPIETLSVKEPLPPAAQYKGNPYIVKISIISPTTISAITDIDFKELPKNLKNCFIDDDVPQRQDVIIKNICAPGTAKEPNINTIENNISGFDLLFRFPSIDTILKEKLYQYLYFIILSYIKKEDNSYFLDKFKKAIIAILDVKVALIKQSLNPDKKNTNDDKLIKKSIINNNIKILDFVQSILSELNYDNYNAELPEYKANIEMEINMLLYCDTTPICPIIVARNNYTLPNKNNESLRTNFPLGLQKYTLTPNIKYSIPLLYA